MSVFVAQASSARTGPRAQLAQATSLARGLTLRHAPEVRCGRASLLPALKHHLPSKHVHDRSGAPGDTRKHTGCVPSQHYVRCGVRNTAAGETHKLGLCVSLQAQQSRGPSTASARCAWARGPAAGSATPPGGAPPTARSGARDSAISHAACLNSRHTCLLLTHLGAATCLRVSWVLAQSDGG